jgi:hypothetical protein
VSGGRSYNDDDVDDAVVLAAASCRHSVSTWSGFELFRVLLARESPFYEDKILWFRPLHRATL